MRSLRTRRYRDGEKIWQVPNYEPIETRVRPVNRLGGPFDNPPHEKFIEGTIAFFRMWHGTVLDANDVRELYEERDGPPPDPILFFDLRGCTQGVNVTDSVDASLQLHPMSGDEVSAPTCDEEGMQFDGEHQFAAIDPLDVGGEMSFEVSARAWGTPEHLPANSPPRP